MDKIFYFKNCSFELIQGIVKEQIIIEFSKLSIDQQKRILSIARIKSINQFQIKSRSFSPYVVNSENVRVLPFIALSSVSLDLCCKIDSYYVPSYPIPRKLGIIGLHVDSPYFFNNRNSDCNLASYFFKNVVISVRKIIENPWCLDSYFYSCLFFWFYFLKYYM